MARLMASLDTGDQPLTVLAATSGDASSAVARVSRCPAYAGDRLVSKDA
jgi:hypothetical protein